MWIVKNALKKQQTYKDRFILIDELWQYFDVKYRNYKSEKEIQRILRMKNTDFTKDMIAWKIPSYSGCIFQEKNKWWYYNLFDINSLSKPAEKPVLHKWFERLLNNICNNNERDLDWLLKAIIFKYTHIDDYLLPAVIFRWTWWSGKWLFIKLLKQIFWRQNCLLWLNQDNINSQFSVFDGTQLIVEYKEIANNDVSKWKANMGKLKSLIMEDDISVERKGKDSKGIKNKAWFVMSSNDPVPLQLDPSDSWNRRFSIIKTWAKIDEYEWSEIADDIRDDKKISEFIKYLLEKFPDIKKEKRILALDNEEKRRIEKLCDPVCNKFFKRLENKEPEVYKISMEQFKWYLESYRIIIWQDDWTDARYKPRNFNKWLSDKYERKNVKIKWDSIYWYYIHKTPQEMQVVEWDGTTDKYLYLFQAEATLKLKK